MVIISSLYMVLSYKKFLRDPLLSDSEKTSTVELKWQKCAFLTFPDIRGKAFSYL